MSVGNEKEKHLIARTQAGDRGAFEELYALHRKAVFGYIRANVRADDDVEDVEQETLTKLWQQMQGYDETKSTFRYFAKKVVARSVILNYWEKLKRVREHETSLSSTGERDDEQRQPEVETALVRRRKHGRSARLLISSWK